MKADKTVVHCTCPWSSPNFPMPHRCNLLFRSSKNPKLGVYKGKQQDGFFKPGLVTPLACKAGSDSARVLLFWWQSSECKLQSHEGIGKESSWNFTLCS